MAICQIVPEAAYKLHCVNDDFNANSSSMVLARPYLMMLYIIFPIHLNFPIRSRCVLKAIVQRKKQWIVLRLLEKVFSFSKRRFLWYENAYSILINFSISWRPVPIFHVSYLSFIYYFCHITFYTCSSFSIFTRDFPFSSFHLIF